MEQFLESTQSNESTTIQSPRLQQLYTEMQIAGGSALLDFWQELEQQGAPLVEADRDGYSWVTFLWQEDGVARNIAVLQDFGADGIREHHMQRLPETDLWFYTRRLRNDTRTTYQFSPSPSADPNAPGSFQLDPFNPQTYPGFLFEDGNAILFSLLELPDAPPLPWREYRATQRGTIELHTPFADQRRFWLYTPAVVPATPLPVLVVFDGRIYKDLTRLPQILDYLIDCGQIPPLLALMVDNPDRNELQCTVDFAAYVAETVMPWLRAQHPVTDTPSQTAVLGASLGGLAALYLAYHYPQTVGIVFTQTGWFRWMPPGETEHHWLARQLANSPKLPLRLHVQVGNLEIAQMADGGPTQVEANRFMRTVLAAKGYPFDYQEYSGGHDTSSLEAPLADGLVAIFGNMASKNGKE